MKSIEISKKKLCNFYANEWHLAIMLLPYVNQKVEGKRKIITFMESNMNEHIEELVKKLNLPSKEKILDINWDVLDIKDIKNEKLDITQDTVIIVKGSKSYISQINDYISKIKNGIKRIEIVNCYEIMDFSKDMQKILDEHDKVLNTSGEKEIFEVFEGYQREFEAKKIDL